jgi:hypothetical protein
MHRFLLSIPLLLFSLPLFSQEVLRGEISEELEPVYAVFLGLPSPINTETASRWALEDSASAFSGMIYGWAFEYEPGERARMIEEFIELTPLGEVRFGDKRMRVTDTRTENNTLHIWSDYTLSAEQVYRMSAWKASNTIGVNATGYAALQGGAGTSERKMIKFSALEDAAKKAIRAYLRSNNKNRPSTSKGYISLAQFPSFHIANGKWTANAHFRLQLTSVSQFSVY